MVQDQERLAADAQAKRGRGRGEARKNLFGRGRGRVVGILRGLATYLLLDHF